MTKAHTSSADSAAFRQALSQFGTGVAVIATATGDGELLAFTASSFNSVSLDPPLVLWAQSTGSPSYPVFARASHFAVNILGGHQMHLARHFAQPHADKFTDVAHTLTPEGVPLLSHAAAAFVCRRETLADGGDHTVFIARVMRYEYQPDTEPLFFWRGKLLNPPLLAVA